MITGNSRKNVPRYLKDRLQGCRKHKMVSASKAMRENEELRDYKDNHWDDRERAQQEKDPRRGRLSPQ